MAILGVYQYALINTPKLIVEDRDVDSWRDIQMMLRVKIDKKA